MQLNFLRVTCQALSHKYGFWILETLTDIFFTIFTAVVVYEKISVDVSYSVFSQLFIGKSKMPE